MLTRRVFVCPQSSLRSRTDCVLGVLSRSDYRRHILRMQQEAKADLVEKLQQIPYLNQVKRGELLRMAMMCKPV